MIPGIVASHHYAAAGDADWSSVVLAMHMDDTGLTDGKGHTVTLSGNAARSATQSKFGGYSAYFDGTDDYLSVANSTDFDFGSGAFTIEGWIYTSGSSGNIIGKRPGVSWGPFSILVNGGKLNARHCVTAGSWAIDISSTDSINTGAWVHFAVVRAGSTFSLFVNGSVQSSTGTTASSLLSVTDQIYIGANSDASGDLTGYLDDLRITKGVARYTSSFTPPTAAFLDY